MNLMRWVIGVGVIVLLGFTFHKPVVNFYHAYPHQWDNKGYEISVKSIEDEDRHFTSKTLDIEVGEGIHSNITGSGGYFMQQSFYDRVQKVYHYRFLNEADDSICFMSDVFPPLIGSYSIEVPPHTQLLITGKDEDPPQKVKAMLYTGVDCFWPALPVASTGSHTMFIVPK